MNPANVTKKRGRGRPKAPHTIQAENARKFVVEQVVSKLGPIMRAKLERALGFYVVMVPEVVIDKKGKEVRTGKFVRVTDPGEIERLMEDEEAVNGEDYYRIWTVDPNGGDIEYLLNQVIGKAKETTEISGPDGGAIEFKWQDGKKKTPPVVILKK